MMPMVEWTTGIAQSSSVLSTKSAYEISSASSACVDSASSLGSSGNAAK